MEVKHVTYRNNLLSSVTYLKDGNLRVIEDKDLLWQHFLEENRDSLSRYDIQRNTIIYLKNSKEKMLPQVNNRQAYNKYKHYFGGLFGLLSIITFIYFTVNFSGNVSNHFSVQGRQLGLSWDLTIFFLCVSILVVMYVPESAKALSRKNKLKFIFLTSTIALIILFSCLLLFGVIVAVI